MSTPDDDELLSSAPPPGLRVRELQVGGERLLVFSFPTDAPDLEASALSPAEIEVARMAIGGLSNAKIAEHRGTSVRTVANQMASLLRKLGLSTRRELAVRYARSRTSEN